MLSLLLWWLLLEILALIALPLTLALLRNLPDRGYPFARLAGILLASFLAWFLGMWQLASYGRGLLILCLVIVAVLSAVIFWRDRTIRDFFREHWRLVLGYEVLFAVALVAGAVLRIYGPWGGPAISHTEQPSDLALMNGIVQSRVLPPQDPWLSGYSINYYYFGYFMAASQALLSGLAPGVAFNLNLAALFALAVTGCFSLGYNLTRAADPVPGTEQEAANARTRTRGSRRRAVAVGTLAVLCALLVGNQAGALEALTGNYQVVALNAGELWTVLRARLGGTMGNVALGHTINTGGDFGGVWDTMQVSPTSWQTQDYWWWPSRALWDERPSLEAVNQIVANGQVAAALLDWRRFASPEQVTRSYAITEFPFFSFYLGDMHPHVMALPLTLLAVALAMNVVLAPERGRAALGPGRWSWPFFVLSAIVLGGLYMANSWDFPTYLLLFGGAWVWRWRKNAAGHWSRQDSWAIARDLGLLILLCIVLYLPFYLTFRSFAGGVNLPPDVQQVPVLGFLFSLPILSSLLRMIGPVVWDKTSLLNFLVIFGLFLYPALSWLVARGVGERLRLDLWEWLGLAICLALAVLMRFPLLLILPILVLGFRLLGKSTPAQAMVALMLLLALLLAFGCELIYIRDLFESRMNTVFKFYYQVWTLLAIVGAWSVVEVARTHLRRWLPRIAWGIPLVVLLLGGLVYPVLSLRLSFGEKRTWTLDGLAFMQQQYPGDYAGVQWLRANAPPDAVVLESVGGEWGYSGRISAATGRPTLLGWDGHEQQWRGGQPEALAQVLGNAAANITSRRVIVKTIYETADPAQARQLLRQYGVDYVFIGSLEAAYPAAGLAKFERLGTLVFQAPNVQIYQVAASP